ncbi:vinorine synthase-like [Neltuma alba]|uniref:vinorine synthase-like n=1 Tax=Neltuma alba TaxID=207710 RepID=UPI0010A2B9C0|nr:vinorine synthase-like [Prosopis alba]XP_028771310.1 vinorine synthase-like [Prosopis alba]XP_028779015.1 vinorine synthase-like [Prosopis alba]
MITRSTEKMKIEVEIISKEIVKPCSPTPQHLRHYHLSFLDQLCPEVNNSWVYFYDTRTSNLGCIDDDASDHLKKSLSKVLSDYYPLAGKLIDNSFVDCNDDGVPYIETRVRCRLNHVIENPSPAVVSKLLPYEMDEAVDTLLGVQVNAFDCCGMAIGVSISHKVADALSYFQFVKSWAAVSRGEPEQKIRTHFQSSSLFPPKDMSGYNLEFHIDKIVCRRFSFEASVIESLRAKHSEKMKNLLDDEDNQKPPSRIEVLSTFIWTRFQEATKEEGSRKIHLVAWTVDLRQRMEPPLPEYAFGNYVWLIRTFPTLDEKGECNDLGMKLREELNKIDQDFIVKLGEGENQWKADQQRSSSGDGEEIVAFAFSSLCRFPVYEVDFGWGNPTWAGPPTWKFKNAVVFKDAISGGGIEAYVSLAEEDMTKLESDEEFRAHVSTTGLT